MNAIAYQRRTETPCVPTNEGIHQLALKVKSNGLNWREPPQSLLQQSEMRTAGSYPTLIIFGSVCEEQD